MHCVENYIIILLILTIDNYKCNDGLSGLPYHISCKQIRFQIQMENLDGIAVITNGLTTEAANV